MAVGCGCYAETSNGELRRIASMSDKAILAEGERMMDNGNEDGALLRFELLIGRAQQDKQLYAKSLHDAGLVYYNRAAYTKAMEYYMKSLDICEQMRLTKETAYLYKDIANVYSMCHDYAQSSRLYKTTLTMARKIGDRSLANNILSNLVFAYQPSTPISQYRAWYNELRSHPDSRPRYPQDVLLVGGTIYGYEKNFTAAINEFRKAVAMAKSRHLTLINLVSANASLADALRGQRTARLGNILPESKPEDCRGKQNHHSENQRFAVAVEYLPVHRQGQGSQLQGGILATQRLHLRSQCAQRNPEHVFLPRDEQEA